MGFLLDRHRDLPAYVPGDHEEGDGFVRLNTNESPYPPSPGVAKAVAGQIGRLQFYNDPDCTALRAAYARVLGVEPACVMTGNGSDQVLFLSFFAFSDREHPIVLPDITYGYYDLFAAALDIPLYRRPLRENFTVDYRDYCGIGQNIVLANPNAPTGYALPVSEIEEIVRSNPRNVVIIDEAYADFGAESCLPLIRRYGNLLVVRTFSKSRSLAGARLGFGVGCPSLIAQLETVRSAVDLYGVSRMAQAAGVAACEENEYYMENCRRIAKTRGLTAGKLRLMGFDVLDSRTNFVFAASPWISGAQLQSELRARGILVRRWDAPRIENFCRITIGTQAQMETMLRAIEEIRRERDAGAKR